MSNLLKNAQRLITTPGMFKAYGNWLVHRRLYDRTPSVACSSNTYISGWLNFSEYWSFNQGIPPAEIMLIQKCLANASSDKTVAIDIGANIGLFTVSLASAGYSKVYAFEPVSQTFARLQNNVRDNNLLDTVELSCLALGSKEGTCEFQIFANSPAINRIAKSQDSSYQSYVIQKVKVTTLDKYCIEHAIEHIDFLKIDVEGMELDVLQGAKKLLSNNCISTIVLEICPANLQLANINLDELYQFIIQFGYKPYLLNKQGEIERELTLAELQQITLANVVVIPNY